MCRQLDKVHFFPFVAYFFFPITVILLFFLSQDGSLTSPSSLQPGPSLRVMSPSASPHIARAVVVGSRGVPSSGAGGNAVSARVALVASQRILALVTEILDMMWNVMGVVKESLDCPDAYVVFFFFSCFFFAVVTDNNPFIDG